MMNIGMLWFDNDRSADLSIKIERASKYYYQKYGKRPNFCYIHPSLVPGEIKSTVSVKETNPENGSQSSSEERLAFKSGEVEVRTSQAVLPNHLWIGVNGANGTHNPPLA